MNFSALEQSPERQWCLQRVTVQDAATLLTAMAGYPSITVPAGYFRGLPLGMLFFGRAWSESTLIKLAYAFEQGTQFRVPPKFLSTVDLKS